VSGWVEYHPDLSLIERPGCYALQIDRPDGSSVVVFEARPASEAAAGLLKRPIRAIPSADADCERIQVTNPAGSEVVGPGPAYLAWPGTAVKLTEATQDGEWRQVISNPWMIDQHDRGPLVVRGVGDAPVRFDGTDDGHTALATSIGSFTSYPDLPLGWRMFFADIWVKTPGCYVLQVDLLTTTYSFAAFEVVP
jgi:hypothetical protein